MLEELTPNIDKAIISLFGAEVFPCKILDFKSFVLVALYDFGLNL